MTHGQYHYRHWTLHHGTDASQHLRFSLYIYIYIHQAFEDEETATTNKQFVPQE
jgi:hypothetical protein